MKEQNQADEVIPPLATEQSSDLLILTNFAIHFGMNKVDFVTSCNRFQIPVSQAATLDALFPQQVDEQHASLPVSTLNYHEGFWLGEHSSE